MSTFTDSYKIPALRKKMWFTFLILSVLVLLSLVPVPGIDHAGASAAVAKWGDAGELLNIISCPRQCCRYQLGSLSVPYCFDHNADTDDRST